MDRPLDLILLILGRVDGYTHTACQVPTLTKSIRIVGLKRTRCCVETGLHLNSQKLILKFQSHTLHISKSSSKFKRTYINVFFFKGLNHSQSIIYTLQLSYICNGSKLLLHIFTVLVNILLLLNVHEFTLHDMLMKNEN